MITIVITALVFTATLGSAMMYGITQNWIASAMIGCAITVSAALVVAAEIIANAIRGR
jgi:hypothetical protein